ncbi:hypothetical protein [Arthrobacter sp. Ld5]|uniref:hypothetical protein n=1 Tax=Arthrobacter sp. Ld5 TaxID=649152 RepID=UPI003EBB2DBD
MLIEILSSTLTVLGLVLLLAALVVRLVDGSWSRTQAVAFMHEGHPYLRWHDHRFRIVEALWSSGRRRRPMPPPPPLPPGEDVTIFYQVRHPTQWSLDAPYRGARRTAIIGLACAVAGVVLGFLPG